MNFKSILDKIIFQLKEESDIKKRNHEFKKFEAKLFENQVYKHQFELLTLIKEAKKKISTDAQLKNFLSRIRNKNYKFISENKLTPVKIWEENKKLIEYYNIDPNGIIPDVLDKSIEISTTKKLNEVAIKSYIGKVKKRDSKEYKRVIKESFQAILEHKSQKDLNKQFKIVGFFARALDNQNKKFVYESLKKLRSIQKNNYQQCIQKLHKLRMLSEKMIREYQKDNEHMGKKSPGKRISRKDLKYIKGIQIEAPRNYLNPEKILVSFQIPFYPVGAFFNELRLSAIDIKNRLDNFEKDFINQYLKQYPDYFNLKEVVWQVIMRVNGVKEGNAVNGRVKIYLDTKPDSVYSLKDYDTVIYQLLKELNDNLPEIFPDELTDKAQKQAVKQKDPNRVRAKRRVILPQEKQKQSGGSRRRRAEKGEEFFDYSDEFGGLF